MTRRFLKRPQTCGGTACAGLFLIGGLLHLGGGCNLDAECRGHFRVDLHGNLMLAALLERAVQHDGVLRKNEILDLCHQTLEEIGCRD